MFHTITASSPVQGRRVAVFGAGGFLGSEIIRAVLSAGGEPLAVVTPRGDPWRLEEIRGQVALDRVDVRDRATVEGFLSRTRPDVVINAVRPAGDLAAGHRQMFETIVMGTHNLLTAAAAAGCGRFVQLGSSVEYGASDTKEASAPTPATAFSGAKAAATMLCLAASCPDRMATVVLRPFMVYGPRDVANRFVPTLIRSAIEGAAMPLTAPGYRRDWVFAADIAQACVAASGGHADGHVVNLGTGMDHANEELVEIVERLTGRPIEVRLDAVVPRPWDRRQWRASTEKAQTILGWQATTGLEAGLAKTLAWMQTEASTLSREDALPRRIGA